MSGGGKYVYFERLGVVVVSRDLVESVSDITSCTMFILYPHDTFYCVSKYSSTTPFKRFPSPPISVYTHCVPRDMPVQVSPMCYITTRALGPKQTQRFSTNLSLDHCRLYMCRTVTTRRSFIWSNRDDDDDVLTDFLNVVYNVSSSLRTVQIK